nr:ABC transporter substrate-binding protein [uncultured Lichenicoccus sp.]
MIRLALALAIATPATASAFDIHRGGTLRLTASSGVDTLDPQVSYNSQSTELFASVYDGLATFPKQAGRDQPVADLAEALPVPTDDGRTYRFVLRPGIHFSNGQLLTVDDVAASLRRIFRVGSPTAGSFYGDIVGAQACLRSPATCTLAGGVMADATARSITIRLEHADPDFLDKLAWTHATILPADTSPHDAGDTALPGTGAYRIVSYDPRHGMVLDRNPFFRRWDAVAQPDGHVDHIRLDYGLDEEAEITAIENGQYDWMYENKPLDRLGEIAGRYTGQVHVFDLPSLYYLAMNTRQPPFDRLAARQAVNLAVDRRAAVLFMGGPGAMLPACTMLPRGIAGHVKDCPSMGSDSPDHLYPDIARARALVTASGTQGMRVVLVVNASRNEDALGEHIRETLSRIGWDAQVRSITPAVQFGYIQNSANKVQISLTGWDADYPGPADYLQVLFDCRNIHPGSNSSINISGFCDPVAQALFDRAGTTADPTARTALWRAADRRIMDQSPAAPLVQRRYVDFVSRRLGHYVYAGIYHMLFSQVWVQ